MLNKCQFIGNLGADPDIRTTQGGSKIANLRLACSEKWTDKQTGEKRERTEWISIAIFSEGLVRLAEQYLRKGSKIYVEGALSTRKWQDQSGNDKYSTEVVLRPYRSELVMLDSKRDDQGGGYGQSSGGGYSQQSHGPMPGDDSDIPFAPEWRG